MSDENPKEFTELRDVLTTCAELFSAIRSNWEDPRTECRAGQEAVKRGLAALSVLESVPR